MMIKIAFLKSRAQFRGGLEKYTLQLLDAFVRKGCEVTLLTTGIAPIIEGVRSISLGPVTKFSLYNLTHFNALCQKWLIQNPQHIIFGMERTTHQTHYRAGNGVHAMYLQRRGLVDPFWKKISFKFNPLHRKILDFEKKAFEDPNLQVLFTNSFMIQEEILSTYATSPKKIEVIHNGVEWHKWREPFEQTFQKKREAPLQLLFIGNGYKRKGLLFLMKALLHFSNKDFHLTVIGKDKNQKFFSDWAAHHGLQRKISFLGPQENVIPFYQSSDVLVIPSIYDPFANVTIEALAMGLFVVSSSYNGGKEILNDFSGVVIEELSSSKSCAVALEKAFACPKNAKSAEKIRSSIKELDFSCQLDKIVSKTLCNY